MIWAFVLRHWKLFGVGAILASALIWAAFQTHQVGEYREQAEVAEEALKSAQDEIATLNSIRAAEHRAAEVHTEYVTVVKREAAERNEASAKALEANPAWANTPVPDAVLGSLR